MMRGSNSHKGVLEPPLSIRWPRDAAWATCRPRDGPPLRWAAVTALGDCRAFSNDGGRDSAAARQVRRLEKGKSADVTTGQTSSYARERT